jgi:hypothetical protein
MKTIISISITFFFLLFFLFNPINTYSQVAIGISVRVAPPELPVYAQPECPEDGYLWTPGYWAYNGDEYYWVPGVWVRPPRYGYYWTPCWWGYSGGYYGFHEGYWGPHVGYYGGVNYGYGYGGSGYYGGRWEGGGFRYNTAVVNVNRSVVHNTYVDRTVIVNNSNVNRTSFNGPGGVMSRPTEQENMAARENHISLTSEQTSHRQAASKNRNQFASVNQGKPSTSAMNKTNGQAFNHQGQVSTLSNSKPGNHESFNAGNRQMGNTSNYNRGASSQSNQRTKQVNHQQNQKSQGSHQGGGGHERNR